MGQILFIGDSHASHLRACLGARTGHQWLAAPSREPYNLAQLSTDKKSLYCKQPQLREILDHYGQPQSVSLNTERVVLIGLRTELPYKLLEAPHTQAVIQQAMRDYIYQQSLMLRLLRLIRVESAYNGPIDIVPNPLISETLKQRQLVTAPGIEPAGKINGMQLNLSAEYQQTIYELWLNALYFVISPFDATLIRPPENTRTGIFSEARYALGDKRPGELRHMNSDYWQSATKSDWLK